MHEKGFDKFRQLYEYDKRAPVIENWYIAARKNSAYIDRWLAKLLEFWIKMDVEGLKSLKGEDRHIFMKPFKALFKKHGFSIAGENFHNQLPYLVMHFASLWVVQEERAQWT